MQAYEKTYYLVRRKLWIPNPRSRILYHLKRILFAYPAFSSLFFTSYHFQYELCAGFPFINSSTFFGGEKMSRNFFGLQIYE
jgi:hypothetical protein